MYVFDTIFALLFHIFITRMIYFIISIIISSLPFCLFLFLIVFISYFHYMKSFIYFCLPPPIPSRVLTHQYLEMAMYGALRHIIRESIYHFDVLIK